MDGIDELPSSNGADDTTEETLSVNKAESPNKTKFVRLPLARVKHMMKMDPDCGLISQDAVFLVTKSTEIFLEHLAKEAYKCMGAGKRKTLQKKDVDIAIDSVANLCFLDGALE